MFSFHSYLSNRLISADDKPVTDVQWNTVSDLIAYGQSNGAITIATVNVDLEQPGLYKIQNITSLTTHKHEITSLSWNSRFNKLMTGDRSGLVVIWIERESKWFPTVVSSATGSPVTSIETSESGEYVVVSYENGQIYCADIGANQKWSTTVDKEKPPTRLFWSTSGKTLYYVDSANEISTIKKHGTEIEKASFELLDNDSDIVYAAWNQQHPPHLLIAYRNGDILIRSKDTGENKMTHCDLEITNAAWAHSSNFFAVSGVVEGGHCQVQFYTQQLNPIRTLNITAQNISSISFNRFDTQLVLGIDRSIAIAQLLPINLWDFFDNTIVYASRRLFTNLYDVVFFNTSTSELHVKCIDSLLGVTSSKNSVVLASKTGELETSLLVLDRVGIPLYSNFIQMQSTLFAKTDTYVLALSDSRICIWDPEKDETKFVHLDAEPSAVCAQGNKLFVSFTNNELIAYDLPGCEEVGKYNVGSHIEKISVSSDMTRISMVNIFGGLSFIDIHSGIIEGKQRKETWSMKWAEDSPDLFVALERQKLYVYFDFNASEAINSLTYICRFNQLEILTVDFTKLLIDPLQPKKEHFHTYETKLLRDIKLLSKSSAASSDEIMKHIRKMPHKRLWQIYGESAMTNGRYSVAEKAFIESQNQIALMFIKRIREIKNPQVQKGFCQWYFENFDEAEKIFASNDSKEFALQMYQSIGNWAKVIALSPDPRILTRAYKTLGDEYYCEGNFAIAAQNYLNAESYSDVIRCYSQLGDIENLIKLMNGFASDNPLLNDIGYRFIELGACQHAIAAFLKAGEPNLAVSACVHLNHWDDALKLADAHPEISKQVLMGQYAHYLAENSQIFPAIEMFIKFKLPVDAAQILVNEGRHAINSNDFLFAKKCFVRAAILTQHKIKDENVWYNSEALHYLMLAQRNIFNGDYSSCIFPAIAAREYASFLGEERTASLLAIAGFYSKNFHQCSKGFIILEHSENFTPAKQRRFKLVAVRIFGKNPPHDSKDLICKCPKCSSSFPMLHEKCKCGFKPKKSIATGRPILGKSWRCRKCKHFANLSEMEGLKVCPLCHAAIKAKK